MELKSAERDLLSEILQVRGLVAWSVKIGVGSFLTANFGAAMQDSSGRTHGAYYLWVYEADWELTRGGERVASSVGARDEMERGAAEIEGRSVDDVGLAGGESGFWVTFAGGLRLTVTPLDEPDAEHWMLYLPDGYVITAGPGRQVTREAEHGQG